MNNMTSKIHFDPIIIYVDRTSGQMIYRNKNKRVLSEIDFLKNNRLSESLSLLNESLGDSLIRLNPLSELKFVISDDVVYQCGSQLFESSIPQIYDIENNEMSKKTFNSKLNSEVMLMLEKCDHSNILSFINDLYINLKYRDVSLYLPMYDKSSKLDTSLIKNDIIKESVIESNLYRRLYSYLLESLDIYDHTNARIFDPQTWYKLYNKFNINESDVNGMYREYREDMDNMSIISNFNVLFRSKISGPKLAKRANTPVSVYISEMNPFNNDDMRNVKALYDQYKLPIIVVSIYNERISDNKRSRFKLSKSLVNAQMQSLKNSDNGIFIRDYLIIDLWDLRTIINSIRPHFEPMLIATNKTLSSNLLIQMYTEEVVMGKRLNLSDEFKIIEYENELTQTILSAISNDDSGLFMDNVPKSLYGLWNMVQSEYKFYLGEKNKIMI